MSARGAGLAVTLLLVLTVTGCEEENTTLVTDIGTAALLVTDPGLGSQLVYVGEPVEYTIQNVQWILTAPADLARSDDGTKQDLLFGEPCTYVQTTKSSFNPRGRCSGGIILGSTDDLGALNPPGEVPVTLSMTVASMVVRRAKPLVLRDGGDRDADGVRNKSDNCPLIPNDQTDSNGDGVGDLCTVRDFFGDEVADSDGDGVADGSDNCVWYQNPLQEDTKGISAEYGIPDGIGDACEEQIAVVDEIPPTFEFTNLEIALATGGLTFVTVDLDDTRTLDLTTCDWPGSCRYQAGEERACDVPTTINLALQGCPETTEP